MKTIVLLFFSCLAAMHAVAQPYTIGDKIKDTELKQMFNYKTSKASLKEFSGKPMILHFWFKNCPVCIRSFPKLNKLEKAFGDKVQILLVTREKQEVVNEVYSRVPPAKACKLPVVIGDSVLHSWFPHKTEPHDIWIDRDGVVRAIADSKELDSVNIVKFINNKMFYLPLKKEAMDSKVFGAHDPIVSNNYEGNERLILQYSLISQYLPGVKSYLSAPRLQKPIGQVVTKCINVDLSSIYRRAYDKMEMHASLVLIGDTTLTKVDYETGEGCYCYELYLSGTQEAAYQKMRQDLDSYFGLSSRVEKRKMPCLVLKGTVDERLKTKEAGKKTTRYQTDSTDVFRNVRFPPLLAILEYRLPYPIINETGFLGNIDLEIPLTYKKNGMILKKILASYGLSLEIEEREMDVIIAEKR